MTWSSSVAVASGLPVLLPLPLGAGCWGQERARERARARARARANERESTRTGGHEEGESKRAGGPWRTTTPTRPPSLTRAHTRPRTRARNQPHVFTPTAHENKHHQFFGPHLGVLFMRRELALRLSPYKLRPSSDQLPSLANCQVFLRVLRRAYACVCGPCAACR